MKLILVAAAAMMASTSASATIIASGQFDGTSGLQFYPLPRPAPGRSLITVSTSAPVSYISISYRTTGSEYAYAWDNAARTSSSLLSATNYDGSAGADCFCSQLFFQSNSDQYNRVVNINEWWGEVLPFGGYAEYFAGVSNGELTIDGNFAVDYTGPVSFVVQSFVAVPEPQSWALMIGGIALVGAAARRRRSPVVTFAMS